MMNGLFDVCRKSDKDKDIKTTVSVYAVRDDKCGYPHFLIYKDREWKYVKAKHFVPVEVFFEDK